MKIAIDIRNIGRQRTGSEVVVRELTRALLALDRDNEYLLVTDTDDAAVLSEVHTKLRLDDAPHARIVSLTAKNKFVWAAWSVWRWARVEKPDVFHTEYILPFFMSRSVRLVTHVHDVSFAAVPQYIGAKDLAFLKALIPWSLKRADAVMVPSQFTYDQVRAYYGVPEHKLVLVYNAVPAMYAAAVTQEMIDAVRSTYQLPEQYVFSLGTMQPRKNMPFLVAAFARAHEQLPEMHLVLSGKRGHNFDAAIAQTIAQYPAVADKIHFTGFIDDAELPAVFAGAKLFVFPSLYEGFGLPLLEALSQGTRVVANDTAVFHEVGGDVAVYADATDLDAFAQALYTTAMCDDADSGRFAAAAAMQAQVFSWEDAAKKALETFTRHV